MSSYKEHCDECKEKLGYEYYDVHRWLDHYASQYWPSKAHRAIRHHSNGVDFCIAKWGNQAGEAATLHIIADEGCVPTEEEISVRYGIH